MARNKHLLIISSVWPEPDSSAAGRRMMELIKLFQHEGWRITFGCTSGESAFAFNLTEYDIDEVSIELNSSTFDNFIDDLKPSAVLFDRFPVEEQFGWRVAEHCPDALRILDTEDLHCLRRARQKSIHENRDFVKRDLLKADSAKREIASIFRCDLSLIISEYEMKLLDELFKIDESLLHYLPFLLDPIDEEKIHSWPSFEERRHYVTIGNFRHAPNLDAVYYLKNEIWPLIRQQLSDIQLHIYGAYLSQQAMNLHQPEEGFFIRGRAKNAAEVVQQSRICLAPLRFGAGLKGKLVEAMQCGTPSITTKIGAEGLAGDMKWCGAIGEKPVEVAAAAVRLYTEQTVWEKAQKQGVQIINERFAHDRPGPELLDRISKIKRNLKEHRLQNFTGAMLMHHTAASTEYMGRWIEEKNRLS